MAQGYLSSRYGIQTTLQQVVLTPMETAVQVAIEDAIQIVDRHLQYWSQTAAVVTPDRLHNVKIVLFGLLEAIRYRFVSTLNHKVS